MKRVLVFTVILFLLSGCSLKVKNKTSAQLIPESVAKKVLVHYFGSEWVNNPRGVYMMSGLYVDGIFNLCGDKGWGPLPFDQINNVQFNPYNGTRKTITVRKINWALFPYIPCRYLEYQIFGDLQRQDVDNIVDALVSLGAKIKQEKQGQ